MNLATIIKRLIIYQEPKAYDRFELLEDETEDMGFDQRDEKTPPYATFKPRGTLFAKISRWFRSSEDESQQNGVDNDLLNRRLQLNLERIKRDFDSPTNQDVVIRHLKILQRNRASIVYIKGIVDQNAIDRDIIRQLLSGDGAQISMKRNLIKYMANNLLSANQITLTSRLTDIIQQLLDGQTALLVEGYAECILIGTAKREKRAVSTPLQEFVVDGPNQAFVEELRTNITLIRQILRTRTLITEMMKVGRINRLDCGILYVENTVNPKIVEEVKRRIKGIDLDSVPNGALAQLIEDHPNAILPQVLKTERPDRVASLLLQGRVAILHEGTPAAFIVPITFFHFFHTSEDFTLRWQYSNFLRWIRFFATGVAVFLPGLYIGLTLYHQEAIPAGLLFSLVRTRQNLPFPVVLELFLMEVSWELIREAGIRVPGVIGQTLGIVGGVILGQAAVTAGLVSPILIIIIAITGLGNFAIPNFPIAFGLRILRFFFTLLGTVAGFYGTTVGIFIVFGLACSMKSFGVPYFAPVAPTTRSFPVIFTTPIWLRTERPDALSPRKRKKAKNRVRLWMKQEGKNGGSP